MNSSFRNLQICVYPAHSNAIGCGKVAFYADFMRFSGRYPLENRHKLGVRRPKSAPMAHFRAKSKALLQRSARLQLARMRDAVPVPRKPAITRAEQAVETRQTENRIEGPGPPDPSRHIQIDIGSRNQLAFRREQSYVG